MKPLALIVIALAVAASPRALANVERPLQLMVPKSALVSAPAPKAAASAPFVMPIGNEPELDLLPRNDLRNEQSRSSCANATTLCYDPNDRRIVFKPARNFMPDLPGLTRENISVKRDRIVFRYSW
jgi:hypothetical protein